MRDCMNQVINLIKARTKCIWINTFEEEALIKDIKEVSLRLKQPMPIYSYSFGVGLQTIDLMSNINKNPENMPIHAMLQQIYNSTHDISLKEEIKERMLESGRTIISSNNNIFILKDFQLLIDNSDIKRLFRDIVEDSYVNYNTIIIISPYLNIPIELEKHFVVLDYNTPDVDLIKEVLEAALISGGRIIESVPTEEEKNMIVNGCKGLTLNEIGHIFKLSIIKNRCISINEITNYKIELIKKSNVLEYKIPNASLDDIGGNKAFKLWINEILDAMTPEALEFGCSKPKGYLALGVPGSAKTVMAESLATSIGIPFLKLDMSKILDCKVGSSEKNMAQAIRMIKSTAPCLLLVDEVEKTLSGLGSSNNSDSGTMARMIGSILEFLYEDHGVFVVMTSNDASQLPPELTRAGRLDSIWYFGLPDEEERKEIFRIHFDKVRKNIHDSLIEYAASQTSKFTGAEIKEAVKNTMRKAYSRFKTDGNNAILEEDIDSACKEIIPVAKSSKEKILMLEEYAKNRARFSNRLVTENKLSKQEESAFGTLLSISDIR